MKENKLMIQDLISIGVFTAIYFVLVTIATFATSASITIMGLVMSIFFFSLYSAHSFFPILLNLLLEEIF